MTRKRRKQKHGTRVGFSTGTAAAAAAQAALLHLLGLPVPDSVEVVLPVGRSLRIPLMGTHRTEGGAECRVRKDGGDDPDATHRAEIGARVRRLTADPPDDGILLKGGPGVGRVTKPGLPVPVGEPAINPVPRRMIREAIRRVWAEHPWIDPFPVEVEIFVPRGEELAGKTLNPRLGILGGVSILGTTGLVKPFSHQAYRATILFALKVARAAGLDRVVLSTGGKSERFLQERFPGLPEEAFVQMGDFVGFSLKLADRMGFGRVVVGAFFGKAVKMAQGFEHTHASRGPIDFAELARWAEQAAGDRDLAGSIRNANTAREVLTRLLETGRREVIHRVGTNMLDRLSSHLHPKTTLEVFVFDFDGRELFRQETKGRLT